MHEEPLECKVELVREKRLRPQNTLATIAIGKLLWSMFVRLRGQAPVTDKRRVPISFETVVLPPRLPISLYAGESRTEALSDRSTGEFSAEGSRVEWLPVKTRVWHNTRLQHFHLPPN